MGFARKSFADTDKYTHFQPYGIERDDFFYEEPEPVLPCVRTNPIDNFMGFLVVFTPIALSAYSLWHLMGWL